jgi:hypothetical protein
LLRLILQGEESVKERFTLDEDKVVPFLEMEYGLEQVGGAGLGLISWAAYVCVRIERPVRIIEVRI